MQLLRFVQSPTLIYNSLDYRNRQKDLEPPRPPPTKRAKTEEDHILSTSSSEQKDSYEDCSSQSDEGAVDADDDTARIKKERIEQSSEIAKIKIMLLAEKVGYI